MTKTELSPAQQEVVDAIERLQVRHPEATCNWPRATPAALAEALGKTTSDVHSLMAQVRKKQRGRIQKRVFVDVVYYEVEG